MSIINQQFWSFSFLFNANELLIEPKFHLRTPRIHIYGVKKVALWFGKVTSCAAVFRKCFLKVKSSLHKNTESNCPWPAEMCGTGDVSLCQGAVRHKDWGGVINNQTNMLCRGEGEKVYAEHPSNHICERLILPCLLLLQSTRWAHLLLANPTRRVSAMRCCSNGCWAWVYCGHWWLWVLKNKPPGL